MRRIILLALPLAGCVTSMTDIRGREIQDDVVSTQALPAIRQCLVDRLAGARIPVLTGNDTSAEVSFSTAEAGMIFHYALAAQAIGTRVQARRKNSIANGFDDARECYI